MRRIPRYFRRMPPAWPRGEKRCPQTCERCYLRLVMSGVIRPLAVRVAGILLAVSAAAWSAGTLSVPMGDPGDDPGVVPGVGRFLVANRQVPGGFAHSVILLVEVNQVGALGLVVNRPTQLRLAGLLPRVDELKGRQDPVYLGGPVAIDHLTLLIRSKAAPPDAVRVLGDVYVSASLETLRAVAGKASAGDRFRAYVGYAGWAPGQLGFEIARGDWLVVPANADDVFADDADGLWRQLIHQQDYIKVRLERTRHGWYLHGPQ
ncbi:MAG: YqgE/AlgH family protein [Gammaproteobacteria bacterium]|nr:YqgE/AlgH family protein [Gammaproteobacteria bacterium]